MRSFNTEAMVSNEHAGVLQRVIESMHRGLALEPLLTSILESAIELISADDGTIGLVIERGGRPVVRTIVAHGMPPRELGAEMEPGVGLAGRVLVEQRPLKFNRYEELKQMTLPELAGHAVIGVPVLWEDHMIGFFGIGAAPPRQFDRQDVETLELFARYAAIAIHNAQVFESEQRRAARTAIMNRIGRIITSSLSLEQILQTAVEAINEHLNYPSVALLLTDPEDPDTLVLRARGGIYTRQVTGEYRQNIAAGIIGAAALARKRILISNVHDDPRYIPIPGANDFLSELAVPILAGDRLMGVLNIESEQLIGEEDVESFQIIADQLCIAIDHAVHYEEEKRRTERLSLIARIGQRITAHLDPEDLFVTTVDELHERLGYEYVSLFLVDPDDPAWLVQRARASRWPRHTSTAYRQLIQEGVIGEAAKQRAPVCVNDIATDPLYIPVPGANKLRAELAMPILLNERLLGVLDVEGVRRFREEDVTALKIIAGQLAVAIDNARLFSATQSALSETNLLYQTSQRISLALDVDEVIAAYLEQVAARGRYICTIVLYELTETGQRKNLLILGRWTPEEGLERLDKRLPYQRDALDPLLDAGQVVTISDVHSDARVTKELRQLQDEEGRPALAMIPLIVHGQRIGLVVLSSTSVHHWNQAELQPYQATAVQLAMSIESRRQQLQLAERGQRLAVLEERHRLARELHDSVTQLIFSNTLIAQSIAPAWRRNPEEGERRVNRMLELSQEALREMRALLVELRMEEVPQTGMVLRKKDEEPGAVQEGLFSASPGLELVRRDGLVIALSHLAEGLTREGLNIEIQAPIEPADRQDRESFQPRPPQPVEEALFRITQEALNNIRKHARAQRAVVQITSGPEAIQLRIMDDGEGFYPGQTEPRPKPSPSSGGLGLITMRERAEALGGTLHIRSIPGKGVTVEATIPLKEAAGT